MGSHFDFQYKFHPAGQGIFASGWVIAETDGEKTPEFHWVFDCGSTAILTVLKPAIFRYKSTIATRALDLLCISHFDYDHVSGLGDLLNGTDVGLVVIPYSWIVERLAIAASMDDVPDEYYEFIADPVSFVLKRAASVNSVLIVGAPSSHRPENNQDSPVSPGNPRRDYLLRLKINQFFLATTRTVRSAAMRLAQEKGAALLATSSESLATLSEMPTAAGWEFMFFHKDIDSEVRNRINFEIRTLIGADTYFPHSEVVGILKSPAMRKQVREIYERVTNCDESVNSTSLCVYSGPCLGQSPQVTLDPPNFEIGNSRFPAFDIPDFESLTDKCSILYTGDANFKVDENRAELKRFLTNERWVSVAVLQVPHHGSRNNWKVGSSSEFSHNYSVFCAHEKHTKFKHPHKEVVNDLSGHDYILANKGYGWVWNGKVVFP